MNELPRDEASKNKLSLLLYQLSELMKNPPIVVDFYDWRDSVEITMDDIQDVAPYAHERLQDLVIEVVRRAEIHVDDLDRDALPTDKERSMHDYFAQVGFVTSEINALKSL